MSEPIYHGYTETAQQAQDRWERRCANVAYNRIILAVGKEKADKTIGRDMLTMAWKEIRVALESLADLAEKQVAEAHIENVTAHLDPVQVARIDAAEARADVPPEVYDFTPLPKDMPDIKFETIDPIPF